MQQLQSLHTKQTGDGCVLAKHQPTQSKEHLEGSLDEDSDLDSQSDELSGNVNRSCNDFDYEQAKNDISID